MLIPATDRRLAATVRAPLAGGANPHRVVLVHGFTQTGACLGPLADDLAVDHEVVLPDAPGHGGSTMHASADLWRSADLLALDGPATFIGYSMGARLCLHLALSHPGSVERLVLIGGTAGIADAEERAERRRQDERLADRILDIGVESFLGEWLESDMFAALPRWARFDEQRRSNTAEGLAGSLRNAGTGTMEPLWDRLGDITVPVLCLAGADDARFAARASAMADAIGPRAAIDLIEGAGHAAHLEAPDAVIATVRRWLSARSV